MMRTESFEEILEIDLRTFSDSRGTFRNIYSNQDNYLDEVNSISQINVSSNPLRGTLRGLHSQADPHAETKIIVCLKGKIFDVAVDVRPSSPTYLRWFGTTLTSNENQALLIPRGFAHGFQTLEDDTEVLYLHSGNYVPSKELNFRFDDPEIGITWPIAPTIISDKDRNYPYVKSR